LTDSARESRDSIRSDPTKQQQRRKERYLKGKRAGVGSTITRRGGDTNGVHCEPRGLNALKVGWKERGKSVGRKEGDSAAKTERMD